VQVSGLEYSTAGLDYCRQRNLDVHPFDLTSDAIPPVQPCDICTSFEVAEHLPEALADRFMSLICALAPIVVLTAATPGQGGAGHINEQPHEYWIEKARACSKIYDEATSQQWRTLWAEAKLPFWYANNVMIFRPVGE